MSRRRSLTIGSVGLIIVTVMFVAVWWALRPHSNGVPHNACANAVTASSSTGPTTNRPREPVTPPPAGSLTVVESGFTQTSDQRRVSVGAVVANNSSLVALRTRAVFRAYTASGESAVFKGQEWHYLWEVPIIRPGQQIVIGSYLNMATVPSPVELVPVRVARATLELVSTQWAPASDATPPRPRQLTTGSRCPSRPESTPVVDWSAGGSECSSATRPAGWWEARWTPIGT